MPLYDNILISMVILGVVILGVVICSVVILTVVSMRDVVSDMSRPGLVRAGTGAKPEHRRETVKTRKEAFC